MALPIPATLDDISPAWLTKALRSSGALHSATVTGIEREVVGAGAGLLGELERLTLSYDRTEDAAPRSVIAKLPTRDEGGRALAMMLGLYEIEARYYREMAPLNPVRSPRCYFNDGDATAIRFVLLLEDLGGLRPGDQVAGLTLDDARVAVREYARFHARFWDTPAGPLFEWIPGLDHPRMAGLEAAYPGAMASFLEHFGGSLSNEDRELIEGFGPRSMSVIAGTNGDRLTIVHGDARLDNIFFGSTDGSAPITILDWQILARAPGTYDIGYLLSQSLPSELRREHERALVGEYHEALLAAGVDCYPWERCWEDYRRVVLYCLVYAVLAGGSIEPANERGVHLVEVLRDRSLSAIRDLNCREFLV